MLLKLENPEEVTQLYFVVGKDSEVPYTNLGVFFHECDWGNVFSINVVDVNEFKAIHFPKICEKEYHDDVNVLDQVVFDSRQTALDVLGHESSKYESSRKYRYELEFAYNDELDNKLKGQGAYLDEAYHMDDRREYNIEKRVRRLFVYNITATLTVHGRCERKNPEELIWAQLTSRPAKSAASVSE